MPEGSEPKGATWATALASCTDCRQAAPWATALATALAAAPTADRQSPGQQKAALQDGFFHCGRAGELNLPRSGSTIFNSGLLCQSGVLAYPLPLLSQLLSIYFQSLTANILFSAYYCVATLSVRTIVYTQGI